MDSYENEASKFAAQRTKLKNICEAHDLTYTFIKNSYPIKLIIRPIKGVGEQMSMLETASEDSYISPDAYLLFTMKDGVLVYRMSKTFTIEDALFGKIKNIFKNMHSYYCQFFFRELIESGRLKAIGGKMPEIPETAAKEPEEKAPDLPPDAEKLEEIEDDTDDADDAEAEAPAADELAKATEKLAREQFAAVTKLMYELRWDFVKNLTPAECRKHLPEILAYSTPVLTEYRHMEDDENVLQLLGIGLDEQIREDTELEDALKMFNAYDTEPEKILLAVAFDATDSSREGYWSTEWNGPTGASKFVHRKNDDLDSTYELLAALGYEMADDEKALQDGTHQLFAVYGSGSQADTPCDKCKAAHPECDKCCKTCDDHCNAFQLCRKEYGE